MIFDYYHNYLQELEKAAHSYDTRCQLQNLVDMILTWKEVPILVFGNGGSAAIAEHLATDWMKGIEQDQHIYPRVRSLSSNLPLITALANDYGYEYIFSKQIEYHDGPANVIAISASGNSPNIVNGLKAANAAGYFTYALVGFDGGVVKRDKLASHGLIHVDSNDYGIVEDTHSIIMHCIAQYIRQGGK